MAAEELPRMTLEEFLEWEEKQPERYEYINGKIYAMAGALRPHQIIAALTTTQLNIQLEDTDCVATESDTGVLLEDHYVYPDVTVVCGEDEFYEKRKDVILNPTVVIEVLSPSTEKYDRTDKFYAYQQIETLQAYLMLWQTKPIAELYTRQEDGLPWRQSLFVGLETVVPLDCINCELKLSEVYRRTKFENAE